MKYYIKCTNPGQESCLATKEGKIFVPYDSMSQEEQKIKSNIVDCGYSSYSTAYKAMQRIKKDTIWKNTEVISVRIPMATRYCVQYSSSIIPGCDCVREGQYGKTYSSFNDFAERDKTALWDRYCGYYSYSGAYKKAQKIKNNGHKDVKVVKYHIYG